MTGDQTWRLAASQESAPYSWCGSCDESWMGADAHRKAIAHLKGSPSCTLIRSLQVHTCEKKPVADLAAAAALKDLTRLQS